jgi:hypothetical protein
MPRINSTMRKLDSLKPQATRVDYHDAPLPGFVLRVAPSGEKVFSALYRIGGYRRRYALGRFPVLQLVDARERARDALELVRRGIDPVEEQKRREGAEVARRVEGFTFEFWRRKSWENMWANCARHVR